MLQVLQQLIISSQDGSIWSWTMGGFPNCNKEKTRGILTACG